MDTTITSDSPANTLFAVPEQTRVTRMMSVEMKDLDYIENDDGSLTVKNTVLLAPGTFTDSLQKTPCRYKTAVLSKYATNWAANGLWTRHPGGTARPVTDKVGLVRLPRTDRESGAVLGDLWYHRKTQASRDTAELVKAGIIDAVSVEMDMLQSYNEAERIYEATELTFTGVAHVDRGACSICKTPKRNNEVANESNTEDNAEVTMAEAVKAAEPVKKELSDLEVFKVEAEKASTLMGEQFKTLTAELEATKKELEASKKVSVEFEAKSKDLAEKLVKIENAPNPKTLAPEAGEKVELSYVGSLPIVSNGSIVCE